MVAPPSQRLSGGHHTHRGRGRPQDSRQDAGATSAATCRIRTLPTSTNAIP